MNEANFCIIVAGGLGIRMGTETPKQFLPLAGLPVLMYSIKAFRQAYPDISVVLVLPEDHLITWAGLCNEYDFTESHTVVSGGKTRFHSVKNGLDTLSGTGLVAIHDGVRPLILPETIRRLFGQAYTHANAIPAISPKDSLRWADTLGNRVIDRDFVKMIQTPQVFELNKLKSAYVQEYNEAFTDDATVWEKAGNQVFLTEGQESNIKITQPGDLLIAETLLQMSPGQHSR
jgi:2-C-methyl-D-erythritol 4-phosphate cytidylyltransferase